MAVLYVERDVSEAVSHAGVLFAAVVAPAGVLMFGVMGKRLGIPPVDGHQLISIDAKALCVTTYHAMCFDQERVAPFMSSVLRTHTTDFVTARSLCRKRQFDQVRWVLGAATDAGAGATQVVVCAVVGYGHKHALSGDGPSARVQGGSPAATGGRFSNWG
jgi:hypothetical protein